MHVNILTAASLQEFTLETVNLMTGEHKKPEFLAKQPFGVIPVFEDDGLQIFGTFIYSLLYNSDREVGCPCISPASRLTAR